MVAGSVGFPREYRGERQSPSRSCSRTSARAKAPYRLSIQGTEMLGPTLVAFGSEEQKRRFLPPILHADVIWCQGFSEPEAGSDLASVRTAAVREGDEWVLHGQKVWTTFGHHADWIYVLARTDPGVQAPGPVDAARADASAGHRGAPDRQPRRRRRVLRGLLRRRAHRGTSRGRRGERRVGRRARHAGIRARHRHVAAPDGVRARGRRPDRARAGRRVADDPVMRQRLADAWIGVRILGFTVRARSRASWAATARSGPRRRSARSTGRSGTSSSAS